MATLASFGCSHSSDPRNMVKVATSIDASESWMVESHDVDFWGGVDV